MTIVGILIGILILSVMMFVHELGHYLTGRRLGFIIEEFSIFMGSGSFPMGKTWDQIQYQAAADRRFGPLLPVNHPMISRQGTESVIIQPLPDCSRPIKQRVTAAGPL